MKNSINSNWKSLEEIQEYWPELHAQIEDYISNHLFEVDSTCLGVEGDVVQEFAKIIDTPSFPYPSYRVYKDGSFSVVVEPDGDSKEEKMNWFRIEWEEEGQGGDGDQSGFFPNMVEANFLDYLEGHIDVQFDDQALMGQNRFGLNQGLEERVRDIFK